MRQSGNENQIDYIEIPVKEMTRSKEFYRSVFGWNFEDFGPGYASFQDGRLAGGFTTERAAPAQGLLIVIYASDLAAAQSRIKAAGGSIVKETFSFPGGSRFHFTDPNGNELAVWSDVGQ
jgi:predicted enzyme related to lactoylglutathione lyase